MADTLEAGAGFLYNGAVEKAVHDGDLVMSISLADVLRQVDLQPGRVDRCQVGDLSVEVRVQKQPSDLAPVPLRPCDVMLDPWTDLPAPETVALVEAAPGLPLLPAPPQILGDERFDDLPTSLG